MLYYNILYYTMIYYNTLQTTNTTIREASQRVGEIFSRDPNERKSRQDVAALDHTITTIIPIR